MRTWRQSTVSDDESKEAYVRVHPREGYIPGMKPGYNFDFDKDNQKNNSSNKTSFEEDKKKDDVIYIEKNETKPDTNWDGVKVSEGEWIDKELFKIGDVSITTKTVIISSTTIIIIILIAVAICLAISYWKRKQIADGARRASTYIRRKS